MNKTEILKTALEARIKEVQEYQINIDNYERAIAKIDAEYSDNTDMLEFRGILVELLNQSKTEQLKAVIMRDVIAEQVNELEAD